MGSKGYTGDLEGCRMPRPTAIIRDPNQEQQVQEWIKAILGEWPEDLGYAEALKDGVILCRLMNVLSPGSVARINTKGAGFKLMENIVAFQSAMAQYGVDKVDIFQTSDLFERKDLGAVTNTIFALDRAVGKHPEWTGPRLNLQAPSHL